MNNIKEKLPKLIFEDNTEFVDLYNEAWQCAFLNAYALYGEKDFILPVCMSGWKRIWQWDSCFIAMFSKYSNGILDGMKNLDFLYSAAKEDGYMSMAYDVDSKTPTFVGKINPPIMGWAEWEYYKISGDDGRLEKVLPILERFYWFIEKHRRYKNGLYWFEDRMSSGMDNSPRGGVVNTSGNSICFVDLACQQAMSAKYINLISSYLGKHKKAQRYEEEYKRIGELVNRFHWCENVGFYFDLFADETGCGTMRFVNHKTIASFWTIISGIATSERLHKMINHLLSADEFYTPHPFATLSKDDPNYSEFGNYWCGSVWSPSNFMIIKGLSTERNMCVAREATIKHLEKLCTVLNNKKFGGIWECYSPENDSPASRESGDFVRSAFVGWGGLGPITLMIENIIGLNFDAENNEVNWYIGNNKRHGLENIIFNKGNCSFICELLENNYKFCINAEQEFTLNVITLYNRYVKKISRGENKFFLR